MIAANIAGSYIPLFFGGRKLLSQVPLSTLPSKTKFHSGDKLPLRIHWQDNPIEQGSRISWLHHYGENEEAGSWLRTGIELPQDNCRAYIIAFHAGLVCRFRPEQGLLEVDRTSAKGMSPLDIDMYGNTAVH